MPALYLSLAWCAVLCWQAIDHIHESRRHRAALERTGEASLHMLEVAMRAVGRGRRNRPDFLPKILEGVPTIAGVRGVWVTELNGSVIASIGEEREVSASATFPVKLWLNDGLVVGRQVEVGACLFEGDRSGSWVRAVVEPKYFFMFVDRSEMDIENTADLRLRLIIVAAATLAIAVAFLLLRARARTRSLLTELAVSEERSRQDRDRAVLGAGLAHETKNPLAIVRAAAQRLVEEDTEREERLESAQQIVEEVDRVVARINEFLQYSRPVQTRPVSVNLRSILEEVAALVQPDLSPRQGQLTIHAEPTTIRADPGMLRQILLNLLVNATCAISAGGRISLEALWNADGTLHLKVVDDGRGIPSEDLDRVFEPYYTRTKGGTGLGLAIVRRLVDAHGWSVRIESEPDVGTTVVITGIQATGGDEPANGRLGQENPDR